MSLTSYKNFLKGIGIIPKAISENSKKGDVEVLTSNNKLHFHNGTINDPIVQENVQATLTLKTLTSPVLNTPTADTITGIAGGSLLVQSASNQDLSLQAQGTGKITLEGLTVDGTNVKNTTAGSNITVNADGANTFFQVTGTNIVRIDNNGIAFLTGNGVKLYDADNSNLITVKSPAVVNADYTITLPEDAPIANTALFWDGTKYKWGAAGGADSTGANDDILATTFRARIIDTFEDPSGSASSSINAAFTTATLDTANRRYTIQYNNTTISAANTTTPALGLIPVFLAVNDVIILGSEVRRITSLSPLTIESAFSTASGSCTVSQTVASKELYGSSLDGASISSAFDNSAFAEYLVDYEDSISGIYTPNVTPVVAFSASQDNATWSAVSVRPEKQTDQIQGLSFASPSTAIYIRLFANIPAGSGSVNLLEYRTYMQKTPEVVTGVLNQAYARLDGSTTPQFCSLSVVGGRTRVTLTWPYAIGLNGPSGTYGAIDVYINGQFIPRQVGSYLTAGAFYREISNTVIELDTNYSTTPYAVQVIQRQPNSNFTGTTGGSSGAVGMGLKNYLTTYNGNPGNGNFENGDTTGWSLFNTTLTSLIPTGTINTGAASITSFAATPTTPLAGTYSLLVGSSGVLSAGQGFISNAFTIDREDLAKVLAFNFSYEVLSGTVNMSGTSSNTFAVYLYDGTNWIQPAGVYNLVQTSGVGYATGTFQTSATATQYRIAVICINATGGAVSLEFDDFFVGPQVSVSAPAMSDFVAYTPTTSGFNIGTTGTSNVRWRRVGDSIHIIGNYLAGGTGITSTGDFLFSLPAGLTFDTAKLTISESAIGAGQVHDTGTARISCSVAATNSTNFSLVVRANAATGGNTVSNNFPSAGWFGSAGDTVSFELMAPITGWSSNTIASNDTDTRVVSLRVGGSTTTVNTSSPVLVYPNVTIDTHGTYNPSTGVYTVPVSGQYKITANAVTSSVGWLLNDALELSVTVDGVLNQILNQSRSAAASTFQLSTVGTGLINLRAGQLVRIICYSDKSVALEVGGRSSLTIERLSGPAVIQATESVNAKYAKSGTQAFSVETKLTGYTRLFDTHNAWDSANNWYRFPVSGKYLIQIQTNAVPTTTATQVCSYRINGVATSFYIGPDTANTAAQRVGGSTIVNVNAGDYIEIFHFTSLATTVQANEQNTHFSISRIGN